MKSFDHYCQKGLMPILREGVSSLRFRLVTMRASFDIVNLAFLVSSLPFSQYEISLSYMHSYHVILHTMRSSPRAYAGLALSS
jgi:hypothetical protein